MNEHVAAPKIRLFSFCVASAHARRSEGKVAAEVEESVTQAPITLRQRQEIGCQKTHNDDIAGPSVSEDMLTQTSLLPKPE